jgi:RND family efflux transporter MFP subunit
MFSQRRIAKMAAAALVVPLLAACGGGPTPTAQGKPGAQGGQRQIAVPVSVQSVVRGPIAATLTYSGNIQARATVNVLPRATGRIERLNVDVGDQVQQGEVIAVLDRTQLEAQVRQSEGALRAAEARLRLLVSGARPEDVQAARAALESAQARLNQMLQGGRAEDIASAQSNLDAAQARLNQILEGATDAEIAAARAAVESSHASLRSSEQRLEQLLGGGSPEDQRAAEAAVETARANIDAALARRDALRNPAPDQLQSAQSAFESAQSSLDAARIRLEQILAGGSIADQVAAQAAVDSAQVSLLAAQERLAILLNGGAPADRASAQAAYDSALAQWRSARVRHDLLRSQLDMGDAANTGQQQTDLRRAVAEATQQQQQKCGTTSTGTLSPGALSPDCLAAQAALDRANAALTAGQSNLNRINQRVTPADLAAARTSVEQADANLKAAQARIDQLTNPTPDSVQTARAAAETAGANLETALARQQQLRNPAPDTLASARSAVESGEANLRAAQARLELLVAGGSMQDVQAADAGVDAARGNLEGAVARREALRNPSAADIANARAAVDTATANLASAESRLADVLAGAKPADLQAAVSSVDQAQQTLTLRRFPFTPQEIQQQQEAVTQARANLALRAEPNRPEDIAQASAAVEQARGAYDLARAQAAESVVYAPFTGVVSAKLLSEGALASQTTPVVTLVTDAVEIMVNVEEARIGQVTEGRPAALTVSAYPGEEFAAVVANVAPTADPRTRTFQAKIVPTDPQGKLKEGMFAQVRIRGDERPNAVLIPNQAIVQRAGKSVAFVVADGKAQMRDLRLGISDGRQTEVLEGLEPGDQLIVAGQDTLNDGEAVRIGPGSRG